MALCPFAVQKPVAAHGGPIGPILGTVIHVTAGEGDPYNEFANPANQVSSHFGIGNGQGGMGDGVIEQYVDTGNESWAQMAGNASYLSVETEGEPTEALTTNQILSFARLLVWMHQEHGVPLTIVDTPGERGLITHGDGGVAWGDHIDCPGPLRSPQRAAIVYLAVLATNPPGPTTTTTEDNMICSDPQSGGWWYLDPDDGHIEANGGAPYLGGMNEPTPDRFNWQQVGQLVGIAATKDGNGQWGYTIACRHDTPFDGGATVSGYSFARNGSNMSEDDPQRTPEHAPVAPEALIPAA